MLPNFIHFQTTLVFLIIFLNIIKKIQMYIICNRRANSYLGHIKPFLIDIEKSIEFSRRFEISKPIRAFIYVSSNCLLRRKSRNRLQYAITSRSQQFCKSPKYSSYFQSPRHTCTIIQTFVYCSGPFE